MYLNKAVVIGNLTRDPELKALPSGASVCSFSLATNHSYKGKDDKLVEQTEYHNIVVFNKQAENCAIYLKKGSQALVEGRLQTRSWDKDGVKQYRTEIIADRVQFGNKPKVDSAPAAETPKDVVDALYEGNDAPAPADDVNPEDIPF